jgi:hypothetical protein
MDWLHHPKFVRTRNEVLDALKRNEYRFRRMPNVLFLCGGACSDRRDRLAEYVRRHRPDTLVFYAEQIWEELSQTPGLSALEMEERLADLSDIVVIVVESPGTFAELGAFSLSERLRKKLLPILESDFRNGTSFIETGPVRWIDADSLFKPSIWTAHSRILECAAEFRERLDRISPSPARIPDLTQSTKHFVFFVCDIISVFGPCSCAHLEFYLKDLLGIDHPNRLIFLRLAVSMKLVREFSIGDAKYYIRPLVNDKLPTFHFTKKHLGLPTLRARIVGAMQTLDVCKIPLSKIEG